MTTTLKLLAAALVALLVTAGLAAANPGFAGQSNGPTGHGVADADRPMDGSNSAQTSEASEALAFLHPWVADDERLDRFQDRFDLTDDQMETIRTAVVEQYESGASPEEMHETVTDLLAEFGVEDADLSPAMDRGNWTADPADSPWVTGDERLDRFQDRFDLTDDQMETIRTEMVEQYESGATPEEMHETMTDLLAEFGVEDADLPPAMDRQRLHDGTGDGPARNGTGPHFGGQGPGFFGGQGNGPHGVMDGSCQA